ncbi:multiheme c-type cytochrome [Schlesneria paludicola]|uniref:multiheme c-type cytochrome n=1 Tax=Schlesneria paludicola TaxID=360056 RepID=UPI00029A28F6|nr:multiheme c-type cytochrome [Schlesneria paludicola]
MRDRLRIIVISCVMIMIALGVVGSLYQSMPQRPTASKSPAGTAARGKFRHQNFEKYTLWWDQIPERLRKEGCPPGTQANIHPQDYAGPEACKNCHKKQYESWSKHPHRWMNSLVENTTVRGNFNDHRMSYLGGDVTFYKAADTYRMRLERDDVRREFVVQQTIGSRYFQYYVGKQLEGPEPSDHPLYFEDHVLPLGYWLDREEWVPTVHIGEEFREGERPDPFVQRPAYSGNLTEYADKTIDLYRSQCNFCHTTFAIGDMFVRFQRTFGRHIPVQLDVSLSEYVQSSRPEMWPEGRKPYDMADEEFAKILQEFHGLDARKHAVTLGISCEACHLGAKDHAEGRLKRPRFFPTGSEVVTRTTTLTCDLGRTHDNVNWACGRCHAGERPQYANGTSTWNSTEYSDAMRGSCYSQLTCIKCHDPHESIGQEWSQTPAKDDASCLSCHQKFEAETARIAHTHHPLDHEGSRCMNCHMPRINEGLQEVVRTHTIFSPTNRVMIETNQLNACNLCHPEQPIDWTLTHLKRWYGTTFQQRAIDTSYPNRNLPVAIGWLKSDREAVRLVAADAITRTDARWALPDLIGALDDPFILNRQFARIGLEKMLKVKLSDFGYQFYQSRDERVVPLRKMKEQLIPATVDVDAERR